MDASIWSGVGAWGAGVFATLGGLAGIIALILLVASKRATYWLGLLAILLAFCSISSGILGIAHRKQQVDDAINRTTREYPQARSEIEKEMFRRPGYREAQALGIAACTLAAGPLLLGVLAALLGARRRRDGRFAWRLLGVAAGTGVTLLAALAARAESQRPLPGHNLPDGDPGWRLLRAQELSERDLDRGCLNLAEELENFYWLPTRKASFDEASGRVVHPPQGSRGDFPRIFDPDPRAVGPDFHLDAFAAKCVRRWITIHEAGCEGRERGEIASSLFYDLKGEALLESAILLDDSARPEIEKLAQGRICLESPSGLPWVGHGETRIEGNVPEPTIQRLELDRLVSQYDDRFRSCYQSGLRARPNLAGRVVVRFIVDDAGNVVSPTDAGSDLPDASVVACIVREFGKLSFPPLASGKVTVTYPIKLRPKYEYGE
ncbi:AgmX/PglI C-terminal domain-containing protein [Pendulispora brunnea]|uniref:AgmX/PglI C-terminal domain-containing protein n=1 Tax=Pendulispora brunnea TaxID=2905690 RepID=A0ABZ2KDP6_9BACT